MNDGYRMRLPRYWKEKIWDEEKRAELTEKLQQELKKKQKKVIEEVQKLENLDFVSAYSYLHNLNVKDAKRQYKKVVKGHKL